MLRCTSLPQKAGAKNTVGKLNILIKNSRAQNKEYNTPSLRYND